MRRRQIPIKRLNSFEQKSAQHVSAFEKYLNLYKNYNFTFNLEQLSIKIA